MGQLEDILLGVNMTMRHTNTLLAHLYKIQQEKEADKTAHFERLFTVNVVCPTAPNPQSWQMLPRNGARKLVALNNMGPSDALVSNKQFDPVAILQQISDPAAPSAVFPAPLQMVEIAILKSGGNVTMYTASPIWVYNLTVTTNQGALISIQEDVFTVPNKNPNPAGQDGRTWHGYTQLPNADPDDGVQSAKALR